MSEFEKIGRWVWTMFERYKKAAEKLGYDCIWKDFEKEIETIVNNIEDEARMR